MSIKIKPADSKENKRIVVMIESLISEHSNFDPIYPKIIDQKIFTKILKKDIADKNSVYFIAYENQEPMGFVRGKINKTCIDRTKHIAVLHDIYVNPNLRGKNIGSLLYEAFVKHVKKAKIQRIELNVDANNTKAINFWRSKGFTDFQFKLKNDLKI